MKTQSIFTPPPPPSAVGKGTLVRSLKTLSFWAGSFLVPFALTAQAAVNLTFNLGLLTNEATSQTLTNGDLSMTVSTDDTWAWNPGFRIQNASLVMFKGSGDGFQMTFNFNKAVTLKGYNVFGLAGTKHADDKHEINFGSSTYDEGLNVTFGNYDFAETMTIAANTDINFVVRPGAGSSAEVLWNSLTVTVVPEPAVYALVLGLLALGGVGVRRLRTSNVQH